MFAHLDIPTTMVFDASHALEINFGMKTQDRANHVPKLLSIIGIKRNVFAHKIFLMSIMGAVSSVEIIKSGTQTLIDANIALIVLHFSKMADVLLALQELTMIVPKGNAYIAPQI